MHGNKIFDVSELFRCHFNLFPIFFRCFFSMFSLSMFCLLRVFAFLYFVVLFFVIDPEKRGIDFATPGLEVQHVIRYTTHSQ